MKKIFVISIILVLLFLQCTHTRRTSLKTSSSIFDHMNDRFSQNTTYITLIDSSQYIGQNTRITQDSTFWIDSVTEKRNSVLTSEIKSIVIKKTWRGVLEGVGIGTLTGFVSGAFIGGVLIGDNEDGMVFPNSAGKNALAVGVLFGGFGGLVGLPIGAIAGSKDEYIFEKPTN